MTIANSVPRENKPLTVGQCSGAARERVALRKLGSPANFKFYEWRCVGPDVLLAGCVCSGAVYTEGPRKGRIKYDGPRLEVVVTDAEHIAEAERTERDGVCAACDGTGEVFASWNHKTGTTWRPCERCNAPAREPEVVPVPDNASSLQG